MGFKKGDVLWDSNGDILWILMYFNGCLMGYHGDILWDIMSPILDTHRQQFDA